MGESRRLYNPYPSRHLWRATPLKNSRSKPLTLSEKTLTKRATTSQLAGLSSIRGIRSFDSNGPILWTKRSRSHLNALKRKVCGVHCPPPQHGRRVVRRGNIGPTVHDRYFRGTGWSSRAPSPAEWGGRTSFRAIWSPTGWMRPEGSASATTVHRGIRPLKTLGTFRHHPSS